MEQPSDPKMHDGWQVESPTNHQDEQVERLYALIAELLFENQVLRKRWLEEEGSMAHLP